MNSDGDAERIWEICRDNFIPVCFGAPLAANFDLADAQTVLSLYESCKLMKMILKTQVSVVVVVVVSFHY